MAKLPKLLRPTAEELVEHLAILDGSDERAAVIMAAAWVDDSLRTVFEAHLARDKSLCDRLLRSDGPLGTFGTRISLAYLYGLVSKETYKDLDCVREIRNAFAHVRTKISFEDQSLKDRCENLNILKLMSPGIAFASPRHSFVFACTTLAFGLLGKAVDLEPPPESPDEPTKFARMLTQVSDVMRKIEEGARR